MPFFRNYTIPTDISCYRASGERKMRAQPPRRQKEKLCHRAILRKIVHAIAILYWVIRVVFVGRGVTPLSSLPLYDASSLEDVDLNLNGGFCPTTSCPIGKTHIRAAADIVKWNPPSNKLITTHVDDSLSYKMYIRDTTSDTFISGTLSAGRKHDPKIHDLVVRCLRGKRDAVFIDIGANIGYFTGTALAVGAQTISFEPFYHNAGAIMATIAENGWSDRSTIYMNALGYESNIVTMESTNDLINKSNMHITESQCVDKRIRNDVRDIDFLYGIDYMEGVSLDQVIISNHPDIRRVSLMKIDVETYEIHVLNGAMHTLCNLIVERIVIEVEYLKPSYNLPIPCNFEQLRSTLIQMNYDVHDFDEVKSYKSVALQQLPSDIIFNLIDVTQSPADRLRGSMDNPCAQFDRNS